MEKNPSGGLSFYLLETLSENREFLGRVRHWENLKMAVDGKFLYVRDFTPEQLRQTEVVLVPDKQLYEVRDHLLFPVGSSLPTRKFTASLLWTPIRRALPVSLPQANHNLFETGPKLKFKVVPSEIAVEPIAVRISENVFSDYVKNAPKARISHLSWTIFNGDTLVFGRPLLPLPGIPLWQSSDFLLPCGFDFEFPDLASLAQSVLNPDLRNLLLWSENGTFSQIPKSAIMPLSISSWRKTAMP